MNVSTKIHNEPSHVLIKWLLHEYKIPSFNSKNFGWIFSLCACVRVYSFHFIKLIRSALYVVLNLNSIIQSHTHTHTACHIMLWYGIISIKNILNHLLCLFYFLYLVKKNWKIPQSKLFIWLPSWRWKNNFRSNFSHKTKNSNSSRIIATMKVLIMTYQWKEYHTQTHTHTHWLLLWHLYNFKDQKQFFFHSKIFSFHTIKIAFRLIQTNSDEWAGIRASKIIWPTKSKNRKMNLLIYFLGYLID